MLGIKIRMADVIMSMYCPKIRDRGKGIDLRYRKAGHTSSPGLGVQKRNKYTTYELGPILDTQVDDLSGNGNSSAFAIETFNELEDTSKTHTLQGMVRADRFGPASPVAKRKTIAK